MSQQATIVSIVYKPACVEDQPQHNFSREPVPQANLLAGYGIENDKKGGHPVRQLNIMSREALDILREKGFHAQPGELGEQIVIQGLAVDSLQKGAIIRLGNEAVVEVVEARRGCSRLKAIQGKNPSEALGYLGVMAKVIQSGRIGVGDPVFPVGLTQEER